MSLKYVIKVGDLVKFEDPIGCIIAEVVGVGGNILDCKILTVTAKQEDYPGWTGAYVEGAVNQVDSKYMELFIPLDPIPEFIDALNKLELILVLKN